MSAGQSPSFRTAELAEAGLQPTETETRCGPDVTENQIPSDLTVP